MPIKGIIFDMDGLLFDTESLYVSTSKKVISEMGFFLEDAVYDSTIGINHKRTREILQESLGPDFSIEHWEKEVYQNLVVQFERQGPKKKAGVDEILKELEGMGLPMAVASSSGRKDVENLLKMGGIFDFFAAVVCGDEVSRSKPEPEIFLTAAEKLGVRPENCLVFEDSYAGIQAAYSAGTRPVMIPDRLPPTDEIRQKVFRVCGSLLEVKENLSEFLA